MAANVKLTQALRRSGGKLVTAVEINSDHSFTDSRIGLASEVVQWLEKLLTK